MRVNLNRQGESLVVKLPKMVIETFRLKDNDTVNVYTQENTIVIKPVHLTLEKIFEGYNGEEYDRYDWGDMDTPVGREFR